VTLSSAVEKVRRIYIRTMFDCVRQLCICDRFNSRRHAVDELSRDGVGGVSGS